MITLGIIGVVAALTMPALITNNRKTEVETKLKKIYSVMNQAISMSVAEYGDVETWAADCGSSDSTTCNTNEAIEWFNTYIGKHLEITSIEKKEDGKGFYVYLKDGSMLSIQNYIYDMVYFTNKRATTLSGEASKTGKNKFAFRFNPTLSTGQTAEQNKYTLKPTFEPFTWSWDGTEEDLYNNTTYGCKAGNGGYCTKLIQNNGWTIPKDYPVRL